MRTADPCGQGPATSQDIQKFPTLEVANWGRSKPEIDLTEADARQTLVVLSQHQSGMSYTLFLTPDNARAMANQLQIAATAAEAHDRIKAQNAQVAA